MKLSLTSKFNLVFLAAFLVGIGASGYFAKKLLYQNAREQTLQNARILMEAANAARTYTADQIVPLLQDRLRIEFLPQSVPSYSATESLQSLRTTFPEFAYKEATLNPTNLRDRATDWEADVVQRLRNDSSVREYVGEREASTGSALFIARPIRISDGTCLACHSTASAAPKTMLDKYGASNGFGWQLNEVVGAQVVSVPLEVPYERARALFRTFMWSLGSVFLALFIAFNLMFRLLVTHRLLRLSRMADEVSRGNMVTEEFSMGGSDEIGMLNESFGRMRTSLASALRLLEG
jgi:HAMP domain-containing protein